jgi:hypothetical protein
MPEFVCYSRMRGFFFATAKNIDELDEISLGSFDALDSVDEIDPQIVIRIRQLISD